MAQCIQICVTGHVPEHSLKTLTQDLVLTVRGERARDRETPFCPHDVPPPEPMVSGLDAVHVEVPEDLCQVPEQSAVLPVLRGLQKHHEIPEVRHRVRDSRRAHLQKQYRSAFPTARVRAAQCQRIHVTQALVLR